MPVRVRPRAPYISIAYVRYLQMILNIKARAGVRTVVVAMVMALAACSSPDAAWQAAEREDSVTAYLEFLARYPEGELADRARERIKLAKEKKAWEHVEFRDNLDNYASFLKEFPDTKRRAEIERRIAELERDKAWKVARNTDTIKSYEQFIDGFPDAPQAAEARQLIAKLEAEQVAAEPVPTERPGNFRVQLGTFRTITAAEKELRRLMGLFAETLIGPAWIETPEHRGGGKVYRLKTVPMSGAEARAACAALKSYGQDCIIVNRD